MPNSDNSNLEQPIGKRGGPDTHKPGCICNACFARRRKAEALAERTRLDASNEALQQTSLAAFTDAHPKSAKLQKERIAKWLQWKAIEPKLTHADAAARLDIAPQTLTNLIHEAAKAGWLQFVDPFAELEYKQIPMVNEVITNHLRAGDKDVAVKMAQATIWKQYAASKGVVDSPTTVLALKIEMPAGFTPDADSTALRGVIVGQPRTINAELVKEEDVY